MAKQQKKTRNNYSEEVKGKAYKYFTMGLNSKEIGKLLDVPFRTVQNWMLGEQWTSKRSPTPIKERAYQMKCRDMTYKEIANSLNISKSTVQRYVKEVREGKKEA